MLTIIIITVLAALLCLFLLYSINLNKKVREWREKAQSRQGKAFKLGEHRLAGEMCELLGKFGMLTEYDQIMTLSSTSSQGSLDLLGLKADRIDFIELKKEGSNLSTGERRVKKLVDDKKVRYVVKDVKIPDNVEISDRSFDSVNSERGRYRNLGL